MAVSKNVRMDLDDLEFLKTSRTRLRSKVTRFCNAIDASLERSSLVELSNILQDLRNLQCKLEEVNDSVCKILLATESKDTVERDLDLCDEYEDKISSYLHKIQNKIQADQGRIETSRVSTRDEYVDLSRPDGQIKLPQLPLPVYSHAPGESLENFFANFESIIDKYNLSPFSRFVYLQRQLKGEALMLVNSLRGDQQSYIEAKNLLCKAFASKTVQKYDILQRMNDLNLAKGGNCFSFVSELRVIIHTVKSLEITVDEIIQFFAWKAMPFGLQTQFINITNKNKPNLSEIEDNIFSAIERYDSFHKRKSDRNLTHFSDNKNLEEATGLATNVNVKNNPTSNVKKFKPCILCKNFERNDIHPISRCPVYKNSSSKIKKLSEIGACLKCSNENHKTEECRFKFHKSCFHCKGVHFSFLCPKNVEDRNVKFESSETKVSTGTICVECSALKSQSNYPTVLPTFSVDTSGNYTLHGLKDSGSQCTFILTEIANKLNLPIVKFIDIQINGINECKPYTTKLVEIALSINNDVHNINAICIPKINTSLKLEGLNNIIKKLDNLNVSLADKNLTKLSSNECIENIDLILGANYNYLLPESQFKYNGKPVPLCTQTPLGIIISGDLKDLKLAVNSLQPPSFEIFEGERW